MGNLSVTPTAPAADGSALGASIAALGLEKTISVDGTFTGAVIIEASNGNGYVPIATFTAPGRQTLKLAAESIRVVRSAATAIPGTPAVVVSGNDDGSQFLDIPVGAPGASVDSKALGTMNTIVVENNTGLLTLTGQPLDTETVTIGTKIYTFQTVLTDVDGNVLIGVNTATSVANLIAAINLGAGSGTAYATSMTANMNILGIAGAVADTMQALALDSAGTIRGIATTETLTNGSWGALKMGTLLDGVVKVQTSEDDTVWTDLCSFQAPGHKTLEIVARYIRVNHVNNALLSTPTVSIGAVNDETAHKPLQTLVSGANVAMDAALGTKAQLVLGENLTVGNPTHCEPGMELTLILQQDGTGTRTAAWGAAWEWPGGANPVLSIAAGAVDIVKGTVHTVDANGAATSILAEFALAFAV